jgi:hypothetical protein
VKLLVDAHTVIWAVDDPSKLSPQAIMSLQDPGNDLLLSAGTIWGDCDQSWIGQVVPIDAVSRVDEPSDNRSGNDGLAYHRGIRRRAE